MNKTLAVVCAAFALATQFSQTSLASNLSSPATLVSQGYAQLAHGSPGNAVKTFIQALQAEPNNITARRYLAHALTQCGQYQQAIVQFQQVAKFSPLQAVDYSQLATAYLQLGNHQQALNCYNQALKLDPKFGPALVGLIRTHLAMSDKTQARALCETAITQVSDRNSQEQIRQLLEQTTAKDSGTQVQGETAPG